MSKFDRAMVIITAIICITIIIIAALSMGHNGAMIASAVGSIGALATFTVTRQYYCKKIKNGEKEKAQL